MNFLPTLTEQSLINIIQKYTREEFSLIRMTYTMLNKSTIDASEGIKNILSQSNIVDYSSIQRGIKYYDKALVLSSSGIAEQQVSYYHPNAKKFKELGDPRFWIYRLKKFVTQDTLIYFTVLNKKLIAIPLFEHDNFETNLKELYGNNKTDELIINELLSKVTLINRSGWVQSICPIRLDKDNKLKSAPKDAGDTFERLIGISPNNLRSADYKGEIELKSKRKTSRSNDTLFSKVPNWSISPISSASNMIIEFGYPCKKEKYAGFMDLYVTVKNTPNNQGLFLQAYDNKQLLTQHHTDGSTVDDTAYWEYSTLKDTLYSKHKKTLWVIVDEEIRDGKIYFKYTKAQLTQKPIFSQFTNLINQGIITYDWRGRVMPDGSKYKDKGHAFRISTLNRPLLFGETKEIDFTQY